MGKDVRDNSRVCRTPPGPPKDLNQLLGPRVMFMAVSLTLILTSAALTNFMMLSQIQGELLIGITKGTYLGPSLDPGTPHGNITIDGDANFTATALLEGWPGDGSPENPFIIDGLDIDIGDGEGHCIVICNTRVSFTISNCNLTGANVTYSTPMGIGFNGAGIHLLNVSNGELINNTCNNNGLEYALGSGIYLEISDSNTLVNNICNNNRIGIYLNESYSSILANNICLGNTEHDIFEESGTEGSDSAVLMFFGFVGYTGFVVITLLAVLIVGKRVSIRGYSHHETGEPS